jgi:hypothetical protein
MKEIDALGFYKIHDKEILMVGDKYRGSPLIAYKYDVLIGSKQIIDRYKAELIPRVFKGHRIAIKYID